MREAALRVVDCLRDRSYAVGELADAIDKSQSWTSEVVSDLEDDHLVKPNDGVKLAKTYEATLLGELLERYALEKVLTGMKEDIPVALLPTPKSGSCGSSGTRSGPTPRSPGPAAVTGSPRSTPWSATARSRLARAPDHPSLPRARGFDVQPVHQRSVLGSAVRSRSRRVHAAETRDTADPSPPGARLSRRRARRQRHGEA